MVADVSNWEVMKAMLTAEYAMPRQETWCRYVNCKLEPGETVGVYLCHLEQLGGRLGLTLNNLAFWIKFYEGLPASIYEWVMTHEQAYTADFGSVVTLMRDYIASWRLSLWWGSPC